MSDNPNPGSSAGGIGPAPFEHGEAATDESGMTVDDAVASSYDAWDETEHGISESARTVWGPELKKIADHEGTNVRDGINTLVSTHINKRYGSPEIKRQALGVDIDAYQINPMPTAEPAPQADGLSDPGTGQVIQTEEQGTAVIQDFMQANPIAQDAQIQESMISVAADMKRQGYAPHLPTMFMHAVQNDPRYSEQAQLARDADHLERARAASVQVSGAGSTAPSGTTDDIGGILDEMIPSY